MGGGYCWSYIKNLSAEPVEVIQILGMIQCLIIPHHHST
ncbi:hypothetical protein SynRS9915_01967 [Synechococcus sp. RS9915]|nr:hypothetical protein SynRS9915_01967 [Synechococcus sp. RS9915]